MADEGITNHEDDLKTQIRNIDKLIKNEEETARLNATTHKDVSMQALSRKRHLQNQKNQLIEALKIIADVRESENEERESLEVEVAIADANETNIMAQGVLQNELRKQRRIIRSSKSEDKDKDGDNDNEPYFLIYSGIGLGIVCVAVGLSIMLLSKHRNR